MIWGTLLSSSSDGDFLLLRRNGYCSSFFITLSTLILSALLLVCMGCDGSIDQEALALQEQASARYKQERDYASLVILFKVLHQGMEESQVISLLGEPEYSPLKGLYYYSSDRSDPALLDKKDINNEVDVPVGLIVDYRDEQGKVTKKLQTFKLGRIDE